MQQEFTAAGIQAVLAGSGLGEGLRRRARDARALVALTGDERSNLAAARLGRGEFGIPRAILFATSPAGSAEARQEGLEAVNPDLAPALLVESLLSSPAATELFTGEDQDLQIQDFLLARRPLAGTALRDAPLPAGVLVVSVKRGAEKIVPTATPCCSGATCSPWSARRRPGRRCAASPAERTCSLSFPLFSRAVLFR